MTFEGEGRGGRVFEQVYYYAGHYEGYKGRGILMLSKTKKGAANQRPSHMYYEGTWKISPWGGGSASRPNTYTLNHIIEVR